MKKPSQRRLSALLGGAAALLLTAAVCLSCVPDRTADAQFAAAPVRSGERFLLDLNEATAEELECLPGIGPALAEHILERRAELGAFRTKEDVLSVSGIGEAAYAAIEPYITY